MASDYQTLKMDVARSAFDLLGRACDLRDIEKQYPGICDCEHDDIQATWNLLTDLLVEIKRRRHAANDVRNLRQRNGGNPQAVPHTVDLHQISAVAGRDIRGADAVADR